MDVNYEYSHSHLPIIFGSTVVLFFAARLFLNIVRSSFGPVSQVPGPWYTKYTTGVLTYSSLRGDGASYVDALHKKYGPIVRIAPNYVSVTDIPSVKRIHTVKHDFVKGPWYDNLASSAAHNTFSSTDVNFHRERRKLLSNSLSESALKKLLPTVDGRVTQTIDRMAEEMKKRGVVDVFKWWFFMTTDVIGELSFGESFRMLDLGKKNQYITDLEGIGKSGGIITTFPFLSSLAQRGFPIPFVSEAIAQRTRIVQYGSQSIQRYKRNLIAEPNSRPTLFTKMFAFKDSENGKLTDRDIIQEASGYIAAGSDTTSNTLTYLTWAVCSQPEIKSTLIAELETLPADFTDDNLRNLPFLNMVIEETLRLYPAAPSLLQRIVPSGGITFAGHYLPGGTLVATQAWSLHRLPDVFPEPEKFNPWRWENPTQLMRDSSMPFGGGARICLGLHLARIELRLGVAKFFRAFPNARVSTKEGFSDADMKQLEFFLIKPKGGRCMIEV